MKKFNTAGMLAVLMLCLTACGSGTDAGETDMNSLTLAKNGSVENTIVESFDKEYYDLEGLNTMIGDSIEQYCTQNPTAEITLTRSEVTDDKVKVNMKYDSAATYMGYNSELLFVGTVQEAYAAGYDLNLSLASVRDETDRIGKQELLEMGEHHIVLMEIPDSMENGLRLECYGDILYVGDNISVVSKKTADIEQTQGVSVVVFK